jgi:hypothetical protein
VLQSSLTTSEREIRTDVRSEAAGIPVWIRASPRGPEYYSGLSRAKLYELAGAGLIRTAVLRQPNGVKGVRLFHLGSILAYIERCEQAGRAEEETVTVPKP